jgi:hypothetical protein
LYKEGEFKDMARLIADAPLIPTEVLEIKRAIELEKRAKKEAKERVEETAKVLSSFSSSSSSSPSSPSSSSLLVPDTVVLSDPVAPVPENTSSIDSASVAHELKRKKKKHRGKHR